MFYDLSDKIDNKVLVQTYKMIVDFNKMSKSQIQLHTKNGRISVRKAIEDIKNISTFSEKPINSFFSITSRAGVNLRCDVGFSNVFRCIY